MGDEWGDLAKELSDGIRVGDLGSAADRVVAALREIPNTPYHIAATLEFTNDPAEVAASLDRFLAVESESFDVGAIYTETNGFYINPDRWYFDWFAYKGYGGLDDPDWIAYWESGEHPNITLTGMEALQEVYAAHQGPAASEDLERAEELCSLLVVVRFQQLMQRSLPMAKRLSVPVLATAHDFELFYEYRRPGAPDPRPIQRTDPPGRPAVNVPLGAEWYEMAAVPPPRGLWTLSDLHRTGGEPMDFDLGEVMTAGERLEDPPDSVEVGVLETGKPRPWSSAVLNSVPVVDERVAEALRRLGGDDVQLVPATVEGHAGRYYALVITRLVECLNAKASGAKTHRRVYGWFQRTNPPNDIATLNRLVIHPDKVPPGARMFRVARLHGCVVVCRELAVALANAGVSGIEFLPLA